MQTITKRVLTQEHLDAGLYTQEDGVGIYLYHKNREQCIAAFGIHTTIENIWKAADKFLKENRNDKS
jgi:hypothetical protein